MSLPAPACVVSSAGAGLQPMQSWPRAALDALRSHASVVRVLVANVRGSAPRETGACMLVTEHGIAGTIGGGHLEWEAISAARDLLPITAAPARLQRLVLGRELAQCCGGVVELWFERYTAVDRPVLEALGFASPNLRLRVQLECGTVSRTVGWGRLANRDMTQCHVPTGPERRSEPQHRTVDSTSKVRVLRSASSITLTECLTDAHPPVWLYGAGHVGQAIAKLLAELPLSLTWIDSRAELFPADCPEHIRIRNTQDPAATVALAPAGARFIVMTHDHALDYALCRAILARNDFAFAGLIGSASKAARFRSRLSREDGFDAARIARLVCPIGVEGIASKWPAAIAVSVAAQLLQTLAAPERTDAIPTDTCDGASAEGCAACQPAR